MSKHVNSIIIADTEITVRDRIAMRLRVDGNHVVIVESGFQLLSLIEKSKYDLVIMTTELGDMSAFELVSLIRSRDESKNLPLFLLNTSRDKEWVAKIIAEGVDDYENKTNENAGRIIGKIRNLLEINNK